MTKNEALEVVKALKSDADVQISYKGFGVRKHYEYKYPDSPILYTFESKRTANKAAAYLNKLHREGKDDVVWLFEACEGIGRWVVDPTYSVFHHTFKQFKDDVDEQVAYMEEQD